MNGFIITLGGFVGYFTIGVAWYLINRLKKSRKNIWRCLFPETGALMRFGFAGAIWGIICKCVGWIG